MRKLLKVFVKKDYISLFWACSAGSFGDNMLRTAFAAFIAFNLNSLGYRQYTFYIAAALMCYMLPFFIFSGLSGQVSDKFSKAKVIRTVKFTEILSALLAAFGFYIKSPAFLLGVIFILGMQGAFLTPVKYAVIPQIVRREQLVYANSIIEAGRYLSILAGTLLGLLFAKSPSLGLNVACPTMIAVSFAGFGASLFMTAKEGSKTDLQLDVNIFKSLYKTAKLCFKDKNIFLCMLAIGWFWVLGAIFIMQLPDLSKSILHADDKVLNYMLTLFTCSVALGALLCRKLLKASISVKYLPLSMIVMSLAMLDLSWAILNAQSSMEVINLRSFISTFGGLRISLDICLISLCAGLYIVPLISLLQVFSSSSMRGRVFGASTFLNALAVLLASLASLILLSFGFGTPLIIVILAFLNIVGAIYICKLLPDYVLRSALFFILNSLYTIKVKGMDNYCAAGGRTLIIANNNSFLDPLIMAAFLPDDIAFVVDSTVAKRFWVRIFLRFIRHYPVDPTNAMSVKTIIDEVKNGRKVIIFPEGRISTTGGVMKIYHGPAMIAEKSGAKILPMFVQGTQYSRFAYFGRKLRHRPDVEFSLNIMPAVKLDLPGHLKSRERRYKAEDKVYDLMTDMRYRSANIDITLVRALMESTDFAGRGLRALEDVNRKSIDFATLLTGMFLLGKKFTAFTSAGEFTGVLLPNVNACAVTIFGLMAYGRVPAMINFSSGVKNILSACKAADIKTVITSKLFIVKGGLESVRDAIENAGVKMVYLEDLQKEITLFDKLKALVKSNFPYFSYKRACKNQDPNSPAVVLFTSGSEGVPKGVVLSHRNINANRCQLSSVISYGLEDKFFNALPMFHSFGLVCGLFMPLLSGASVFLYPSPLHYKIVPELVYDRNATVIFGTDTFLNAYGRTAHPYDFYSLRYAAVGAEKLKDETFKLWSEKFGIRILEAYGATEMSPGISFTTPMYFKRGTVGRIFPGIEYRLEKVPGIEDGGRLWVKGDNVMLGYLKEDKPGLIQPPDDGWYDTGDIVEFDDDGFIIIKGRAKRFAKIAGEMVSLSAVETALTQLWPQYMQAVVRAPDAKKGEQLVAYTTNPDAKTADIQEYFKENGFSELWVPKRLNIVENLPIMGNGKVDYVTLQEKTDKENV